MNNNALAVLLGLAVMVLGSLNIIDERVRAITTLILVIVGFFVLLVGIFSDDLK